MRLDFGSVFTILNIILWILIVYLIYAYYKKIRNWVKKVNMHIDNDKKSIS